MTNIIGASFNVWKKIDDTLAPSEIANLQDRYPNLSFAGLQEIDWRLTHSNVGDWEFFQADGGHAARRPIIWNPEFWPWIVAGEHNILTPRKELSDGSTLVERTATWVVLENSDDERVGVINTHLHANVQRRAGVPNGSEAQMSHFIGTKRLIEISNAVSSLYECPVVVIGDFNVDFDGDKLNAHPEFPYYNMTKAGYQAVWELGSQPTRSANPHDSGTIDYAYGKGVKFTRVRTPNKWDSETPILSDHLPVVFDFTLDY